MCILASNPGSASLRRRGTDAANHRLATVQRRMNASGFAQQEGNLGVDAVMDNLAVFDRHLHFLDVDRLNSSHGFGGLFDGIGRCVLPTLVRLGQDFDYLKHCRG